MTQRLKPDGLIVQCWAAQAQRVVVRRLKIEWLLASSCWISCDETLLEMVINNLCDNAVSHAVAGGVIRIHTTSSSSTWRLVIGNTAVAMGDGAGSRVFDRFWRGGTARSGDGRHCGLGLSLCQVIVRVLGATISVDLTSDWFSVVLCLPSNAKTDGGCA
jgi:K+-sensing histidine kinase KdpD